MICGIGTDICQLSRIERMLKGSKRQQFLDRTFTAKELALAPCGEQSEIAFYGGRWAAKEAIAKALGCGFGSECGWLDIEILRNEKGAPQVSLNGKAKITAAKIEAERFDLSISHERDYAVAFAVLSKIN